MGNYPKKFNGITCYNNLAMKDLSERYQLPKKVQVAFKKVKEGGFIVEFPDLPGCFTQAEDLSSLDEQVTDAILTYFDVPRKEAYKVVYIPENKYPIQSRPLPTNFDLFLAA